MVTWSAGNHAQAVAWAAAAEGVDCLVQMWDGVSPLKVEATRSYGATVDLSPPDAAAAYDRALALAEEEKRVFVHPHSDPFVVAGHGTLALELVEDVPQLETIVVGVGGGGLVSGIVTALEGRARVVAVEPEQAQCFTAGLAAGQSVRVETNTIADGLAPPFAGELPLAICRDRVESGTRDRGRDRSGDALPLRARQACVRAGGCRRGGRRPRRQGRSGAWSGRDRLGRQRGAETGRCYLERAMKAGIHPEYVLTTVTCSCGNTFQTRSTKPELHVELCSQCHPFYTGKQKLVDTGGRVERFQRRLERAGQARRG